MAGIARGIYKSAPPLLRPPPPPLPYPSREARADGARAAGSVIYRNNAVFLGAVFLGSFAFEM
ncbi:MAG: hypothetical protein M1826_001182 [Phylliscum demangeonii]|nr:MAG: hypothetical protein M1826_001182 [Phylliscum demangeonii]